MTREKMMRSMCMAGRVRRYHTWPTHHVETVAEHSWGVAIIYMQIFRDFNEQVLAHVMIHDVAELVTGDLPFPVKTRNPDLRAAIDRIEARVLEDWGVGDHRLTNEEITRIKVCDLLQMWQFGSVEIMMGNQYAVPIRMDAGAAALALAETTGDREAVDDWMTKQGDVT